MRGGGAPGVSAGEAIAEALGAEPDGGAGLEGDAAALPTRDWSVVARRAGVGAAVAPAARVACGRPVARLAGGLSGRGGAGPAAGPRVWGGGGGGAGGGAGAWGGGAGGAAGGG